MKKLFPLIGFIVCNQVFCSVSIKPESSFDAMPSPLIPLHIEEDFLDSRYGFVWRDFEKEEGDIKYIVLHYTVSKTYDSPRNWYPVAGVSAHFHVNFDGHIYKTVPEGGIAFHAGISAFNGDIDLNRFSVGIEQVHPACVLERWKYDNEPWSTISRLKWDGDDKTIWFVFPQKQYEATGMLARNLQLQYKVHGRFVVGHADIAPGRKLDPGPMFPYRLIFEKFNTGYYPSFDKVEVYKPLLSSLRNEDFLGLLEIYGYDFELPNHYQTYDYEKVFSRKQAAHDKAMEDYQIAEGNKSATMKPKPMEPKMPTIPSQEGYEVGVLDSFRLHFCSDAKTLEQLSSFGAVSKLGSKELSDLEKVVILGLTIGYYHYYDKDLGYDEPFRKSLQSFVQDSGRKERLKDLCTLLDI